MDCPEDTNSYIHRAGRTARYQGGGESLLVLLPSEESMIDQLRERKIPINMIKYTSLFYLKFILYKINQLINLNF